MLRLDAAGFFRPSPRPVEGSAMAQLFHRSANTIARATIGGIILGLGAFTVAACMLDRSPYATDQNVVRDQPVPFSHAHHVRDLGLDCRYCHTSVTDSTFAGIPPTKTCMTCHSRIWTDAAILQPVRQSWSDEIPIHWTRVHNLPDFVYFPHDIHVNKGVACVECHGPVNQMPLMFQAASLEMSWCLECHRDPADHLRPRDQVFNMDFSLDERIKKEYSTPEHPVVDQKTLGQALVSLYHVPTDGRITNCYTCHR